MSAPSRFLSHFARAKLRAAIEPLLQSIRASYGPLRLHQRKPFSTVFVDEAGFPEQAKATFLLAPIVVRDQCGDGERTVCLITLATLAAVLSETKADDDLVELISGLRTYSDEIAEYVMKKLARSLQGCGPEHLQRTATTAALGDNQIGEEMLEAFRWAGKDGIIRVTPHEAREQPDTIEVDFHACYYEGLLYPDWIGEDQIEDAYVLISDDPVERKEIEQLQAISEETYTPILCLTPAPDEQALQLAKAHFADKPVVLVWPARTFYWQDCCEDIAVVTGGKIFSAMKGKPLSDIEVSDLGHVKTVPLEDHGICLHHGGGEPKSIQEHQNKLRMLREQAQTAQEKQYFAERLCRTAGGIAEFHVCADSTEETQALQELIENALYATRALLASAIVPGGGAGYARCAEFLRIEDHPSLAHVVFAHGLEEPLRALAESAGDSWEEIKRELRKYSNTCYDATTQSVDPMLKDGPIEAASVVAIVASTAGKTAADILEVMCSE